MVEGGNKFEDIQVALDSARKCRLDGRLYEYYQELVRIAAVLGEADPEGRLRASLEATAREIGYKGLAPTDDEVEGAMRDVERCIAEARRGQGRGAVT